MIAYKLDYEMQFFWMQFKKLAFGFPDYGGRLTSATMKVTFGSVFNEEGRDESEKCRFLLTMLLLVSSGVSVPAANAVENEGASSSF